MDKKRIAILVVVTVIAIVIAVSTIAISFSDSSVAVGETDLDNQITQDTSISSQFKGKVVAETEAHIYNSGVLDLEDLEVYVEVYFIPDSDPTTKHLVGERNNELGTVPAGENVSKTIKVDLTKKTATLAVQDGKFEINLDISLSVQALPRTLEFEEQTEEQWDAPFSTTPHIYSVSV